MNTETPPLVNWLFGADTQQKNAASRRSIREDFVRTYPGWIQAQNNLAAASFELDAAKEQAPQRSDG